MNRRVKAASGMLILMAMMTACGRARETTPGIATKESPQESERILKNLEQEWSTAPFRHDAAALDRIIADDWVSFTWDGETITKAQVIADASSGANTAQSQEMQDVKVRVFGDSAVVTGGLLQKSQYQGRDMSGHYLWTDVFVRRNGRWQAVASQTTRVPEGR